MTEYQKECFRKTQEGRDQGKDSEPDGLTRVNKISKIEGTVDRNTREKIEN
mgnify:CR=1 FL=1